MNKYFVVIQSYPDTEEWILARYSNKRVALKVAKMFRKCWKDTHKVSVCEMALLKEL